MAGKTAILAVRIVGDASSASRAFDDQATKAERWQQKTAGAARVAGVALVGLAAAGLGAAKAAEAVASADARTANVLASMGYPQATARVKAYAESLETQLGVDEKTIKATQAKLATFGQLAKSADTAGGAFDRATVAALDLAATGFGEAESNAVQLGKALQDPAKGLTALGRAGVTFTAAEQEKIKALQESGNMLQAQEILLAAVEKQVGGTAAATADDSEKMRLAFGNVVEEIGAGLLPVMAQLVPYVEQLAEWMSRNASTLLRVGAAAAAVAAGIVAVNAALKVYIALSKVWALVTKAAAAAQIALNVAMMLNPVGLVVAAIVALVAILVLAYKKSETFRKIVHAAFRAVANIVKAVAAIVRRAWEAAWRAISAVVRAVVRAISAYVRGYVAVVRAIVTAIRSAFTSAFQRIRDTVRAIMDGMKAGVRAVADVFSSVLARIRDAFSSTFGRIRDAVAGVLDRIRDAISAVMDRIGALGDAARSVVDRLPFGRSATAPAPSAARFYRPSDAGAARSLSVPSAGSARQTVTVSGVADPQAVARVLSRALTGARVRTGYAGLRL